MIQYDRYKVKILIYIIMSSCLHLYYGMSVSQHLEEFSQNVTERVKWTYLDQYHLILIKDR